MLQVTVFEFLVWFVNRSKQCGSGSSCRTCSTKGRIRVLVLVLVDQPEQLR